MHLDFDNTITGACLASSAFYVKTESSLFIAARFGIRGRREQITDQIKHTRISCRVGPRGTPDRRLIDSDHFIHLIKSFDPFVFSRNSTRTIQVSCKLLVQNLIDKRTLS